MSNGKILVAFDDLCSKGDLDTAVEATVSEWEALLASTGSHSPVVDASLADFALLDALQERDSAVVTLSEFKAIPYRVAIV